jgi:hypothetical protein
VWCVVCFASEARGNRRVGKSKGRNVCVVGYRVLLARNGIEGGWEGGEGEEVVELGGEDGVGRRSD